MGKRQLEVSLTLPDRFYIENHGDLSVEQLAKDLGKPLELIIAYCEELIKKSPTKKRASQLMNRPGKRKGVISMTEAASMAGDDAKNSFVTLDAINNALADGNIELSKELKQRYNNQEQEKREIIRGKYSDIIHYIQKPDDDDEVY